MPIVEDQQVIPGHQFELQKEHEDTEQIHRWVKQINNDLQKLLLQHLWV